MSSFKAFDIPVGNGPSSHGDLVLNIFDLKVRIDQLAEAAAGTANVSCQQNGSPISEQHVRQILKDRLKRHKLFDKVLFCDPAWDMLLELYASELGYKRVSVTSLGIASAAPATTALRWLVLLENEGWVVRSNDPLDARRRFVSLTPKASAAMEEFFAQSNCSHGV